MIVDVTLIEDAVTPFAFEMALGELDLDLPHFRLTGLVRLAGEIEKHVALIGVRGNISGTSEVDCTRCLQPVPHPLAIDFEVEYLTEGVMGRDGEHEISPIDLEKDELRGNTLDLTQLAREQILLSISDQFFCRDDCKGLCERCGENLNLIDCKCGDDEIDPRWEALKNLNR